MNNQDPPEKTPPSLLPGQIRISKSLLQRASQSDPEALQDIFNQFLSTDEKVIYADYLGVEGIWGIGKKSFCCLTDRRIAALRVGAFKEVVYNDGYLEHTNSGVVYQPSKFRLYLFLGIATIAALYVGFFFASFFFRILAGDAEGPAGAGAWTLTVLVGLLMSGLLSVLFWLVAARIFYRFSKCGLVWWIRQGVSVYVFSNRSRLTRANHIYRLCAEMRDERLKTIRELA